MYNIYEVIFVKVNDLTGKKFGKLSVIERCGSDSKGLALWVCRCDCGKEKVIRGHDLVCKKGTKSCGCSRIKKSRRNFYIEIGNETKTLSEWCKHLNVSYNSVQTRIYKGWDAKTALTTPFGKPRRNKRKDIS